MILTGRLLVLLESLAAANRRFLWSAEAGRLPPTPSGNPPTLNDSSPGGSYHWNQVGGLRCQGLLRLLACLRTNLAAASASACIC